MVDEATARRGSVGGAAGDAGTEYRRGVGAYVIACGLAGVPCDGIFPPGDAHVAAVALETDDAVDDLRIDFTSGKRAFVQAKRTLRFGEPFKTAAAQWIQAAREGVDPARDRLVIVAGGLSGPIRHLQQVLNRRRTTRPGAPTPDESRALANAHEQLEGVDEATREVILQCAMIWELAVEDPSHPDAKTALSYLRNIVDRDEDRAARHAWQTLLQVVGCAARLRSGHDLDGWAAALHGEGVQFRTDGSYPSAQFESRRLLMARYSAQLAREGNELDLRSLGAELPSVPLAKVDAGIHAIVERGSDSFSIDLLWSFLRRGRVVLTGLPGSGKSTALMRLAAELSTSPELPLPVYVSLPVATKSTTGSFRDRLIAEAVRNARPTDRPSLEEEINRRLDEDRPVALLLDSLDETDDHRAVVSEIARLVPELPEGACVLLATRDMGYGQASTLGWPSLRLRAPTNTERTIESILTVAATHSSVPTHQEPDWVAKREAWVHHALEQDELLRETPLIPVLLSLLAARREAATLPSSRAGILRRVIEDIVANREFQRSDGKKLNRIGGLEGQAIVMQAFATEAATIQSHQGEASKHQVIEAIAAELQERWGQLRDPATTLAASVIKLFDQTGIFVISGARETVTARIALFAELGDALHALSEPAGLPGWVQTKVAHEQYESLVLACTLSTHVVEAAAHALEAGPTNTQLATAIARAGKEGATLDQAAIRPVAKALIRHLSEGAWEGWKSWDELLQLPLTADLRTETIGAARLHSPEHELVVRATLRFADDNPQDTDDDNTLLREVIALTHLPARSTTSTEFDIEHWLSPSGADETLAAVQVKAAHALLQAGSPGAANLIVKTASYTPDHVTKSLKTLLSDHGLDAEAEKIGETGVAEHWGSATAAMSRSYDDSVYTDFLRLIAEEGETILTAAQATRCDHLAQFVSTVKLDGLTLHGLLQDDPALAELVRATITLFGFDARVLATQAKITSQRIDQWNTLDPYLALFNDAPSPPKPDWGLVQDPEEVLHLVIHMFTRPYDAARWAAQALWSAPISDIAAPKLRELLPHLTSSPRHQRLAAGTLVSLRAGLEPACWMRDDDPVLRAVAAERHPVTDGHQISQEFRNLLNDPDGYVQEYAVKRLAKDSPPGTIETLQAIADRPLPGWTCHICRYLNPAPGPDSTPVCAGDDCQIVGAYPAETASQSLWYLEQ